MSRTPPSPAPRDLSTTGLALDIHQWLSEDHDTGYAARLTRDRAHGRALLQDDPDLNARLLVTRWWQAMDQPSAMGARFDSARRLARGVLILSGSVTGMLVCGGALAYAGQHPVNLLAFFGVLLVLPGVLMLVSLLAATLSRAGVGPRRSLGPLRQWLLRWLQRHTAPELKHALSRHSAYSQVTGWLLLALSQWFAVAFYAGAVLTTTLLVAFTDLAFGWSTTLNLSAQSVATMFQAMAWPWQAWWPRAVPDLALVQSSQYFRLADSYTAIQARNLGAWWPFVVMSLLCWGLAPRLLLLVVARVRLTVLAPRLLLAHPEVTALIDRLRSPDVQHQGTPGVEPLTALGDAAAPAPPPGRHVARLSWNQALREDGVIQLSARQTDDDLDQALKSFNGKLEQVVVYTKGWEPPVLELMDALARVRASIGEEPSIVVSPVALDGQPLTSEVLDVWHRAVHQGRDPRLYVAPTGDATA